MIGSANLLADQRIKSPDNTGFAVQEDSIPAVDKTENWPAIEQTQEYKELAEQSVDTYHQKKYDYGPYLQEYTAVGDYLNYGTAKHSYDNLSREQIDAQGVPKAKYGDNYYYNPTTVAQWSLTQYGKYLQGDQEALNRFFNGANRLIQMQDDQGAFRYDFDWTYYLTNETYQPGWVSGMAQGQGLSVFSRAYHLTGDEKYLTAGNKALDFLLTPVEEGGTMATLKDLEPSLDGYIIFEEYISDPNNYTLNGYMFTLLGLYDWWQLDQDDTSGSHHLAKEYFDSGMKTLVKILPYYDIGGFSAYDLGYIVYDTEPHIGVNYHYIHIMLLHALYSITDQPELQNFELLWASYVQ